MNPLISVIMVNYNGEKYLEESIKSLLGQNYKNFELLVYDDNSNDSSKKIIREYAKRDKRIISFLSDKKIGQVGLRNRALKKAKGKYVAVLDSDDIALPDRLETQLDYLENNLDIFLCGSSALIINEEGEKIGIFRKYQNSKILSWRLSKSNGIIHSSIMFRNEGEKYDEKFKNCQDYDFYLRMLLKGKKMINLRKPLVKYRISYNSISKKHKEKQTCYRNKAIKEFYKRKNENK